MIKPDSLLENDMHKLLWDFDIQIDNLIPAKRSDLNQQQKVRTCSIVDDAVPTDHGVKLKECEKRHKYLDLAWKLKKINC